MTAFAACCALSVGIACGARTGLDAPDVPFRGALPPDRDAGADAAVFVGPDAGSDVQVTQCGNGRVEPGEACDLGAGNENAPAFTVAQTGTSELAFAPVVRRQNAVAFYDYVSASAHTGFEAVETSNVFLYVDSGVETLSMFTFAGRDDVGAPPHQPTSNVTLDLTGIPAGVSVVLSDDPGEFALGPTGQISAHWSFMDNTDGGVISGLPWDREWTLSLDEMFMRGVTAWRCIDHDGTPARALDLTLATQLRHRIVASRCRPDCTVPRCGDGVLDAGEHCDDGNTVANDGCSADCGHIE